MKNAKFDLPTLYGDHHVTEVRSLLLQLPGVSDVYASSAFHLVEVAYDPGIISQEDIACKLEAAGYLGNWTLPAESGQAAYLTDASSYFRHTEVFETTRQVGFSQQVKETGRPLWNCPGMGVIKSKMED